MVTPAMQGSDHDEMDQGKLLEVLAAMRLFRLSFEVSYFN
jgi:hypothetical protein